MSEMPPKKNKSSDDIYTPDEAIMMLLPYIKKDWKIWECASGSGHIVNFFSSRDFNIFGTDIKSGEDFLTSKIEDFDCIITNPPFSIKDKFLAKCYSYNKPFALLLPITALEGKFRHKLYKKYGIQIIIPDYRINFIISSGKKSCWFAVAWFCFGLDLPKDILFI